MIFGMFILEMIDIKNLNQAHNNKEYYINYKYH